MADGMTDGMADGFQMADAWIPVAKLPLPAVAADELQIWRVDLPKADGPIEEYLQLLSRDERERAERLRAGRVRLQFVVARASLRVILGDALAIDPRLVSIAASGFGKPETPGIFYNVAHSGDAILIALCRRHCVGVDVESITREVDALEIAKSSFSANEYGALLAIEDAASQRRAFFRCWTRKEAVSKADGRGLSLPLDSFEVPVNEAAKEAAVPVSVADGTVRRYYVSDIPLTEGMAAAYALPVPRVGVRTFSFELWSGSES